MSSSPQSRSRKRHSDHRIRDSRRLDNVKPKHNGVYRPESLVQFQQQTTPAASEFFTFDRRGDKQNLSHGLSQYETSRHRNAGFGRVLGLDPRFRVSRESGYVELIDADPVSRSGGLGKSVESPDLGTHEETEFVAFGGDAEGLNAVALQKDFLQIGARKRRKLSTKDRESSQPHVDSEESQSSSEGTRVEKSRERAVMEPFEAFRNDPKRQRRLELERRTRENPNDFIAWFLMGKEEAEEPDTQLSRLLDIHEQALQNITLREGRELITLWYLRDGAKTWDFETLLKKWDAALKEFDDLWIWQNYLHFRQNTSLSFDLQECLKIILTCLDKCRAERNQSSRSKYEALYLVLRATTILRQAGFYERAVAIWQALLEWTIPLTDVDVPQSLSGFESFWSSEAPRIGEDNAKGWRAMTSLSASRKEVNAPSKESGPPQNLFEWAREEGELEALSKLPNRLLSDNPYDDPFRVVMFADVKDLLEPATRIIHDPMILINGFLIFCQLPPLPGCSPVIRKNVIDPLIRDLGLDIDTRADDREVRGPASFEVDTMTLFASSRNCFSPWPTKESLRDFDLEWVRLTLKQLAESNSATDDLVEYLIAFELQYSPSTAKKTSKALIRRSPEKLRFYNAFALVQARLGSLDEAEKVWSTAVDMVETLEEEEQAWAILLWRSWIWTLIDLKQNDRAIHVFEKMGNRHAYGSLDRPYLRSKPSDFEFLIGVYLGLTGKKHLENNAICLYIHCEDLKGIFDYLTLPFTPDKTTWTSYTHTLDLLNGRFSSLPEHYIELVHQAQARLLHQEANNRLPYTKPQELINILVASHDRFPTNTIFSDLLRIHALPVDRLRGILPSLSNLQLQALTIGNPHNSKMKQIEDILTELNRPTHAGQTTHAIRAAFRRALDIPSPSSSLSTSNDATRTPTETKRMKSGETEGDSLRHNAALWLTYLSWEAKQLQQHLWRLQQPHNIDLSISTPISTSVSNPARSLNPIPGPSTETKGPGTPATTECKKTSPTASANVPDKHKKDTQHKSLHKSLQTLKSAYLTALSRCPFSRALHMLCFLDPVLTWALTGVRLAQDRRLDEAEAEVLEEIYNSMLERGLRVYHDFESS